MLRGLEIQKEDEMTIGYTSVDYNSLRNVLKPETFAKRKIWAFNALVGFVLGRINRFIKSKWLARLCYPDLHFRYFGGISGGGGKIFCIYGTASVFAGVIGW